MSRIPFNILIVTLFLAIGHSSAAIAESSFFDQRYRGWLWFDETQKEEEEVEEQKNLPPTIEQMKQAKQDNEKFAEELELLKHLTIRHPENLEYIKLYKLKEKVMMDRAVVLGTNWLTVNFLNPEILDELKNPQNMYGRNIKKDEEEKLNTLVLNALSNKVELFVFRQDGCPYCHKLEKHLNNFAKRYGFKVEAITPDGSKSKYFKSNSSPELIKALGLKVMPMVVAVDNDTRQRFELARGAVSIYELESKALLLSQYLKKDSSNSPQSQITQTNQKLGKR